MRFQLQPSQVLAQPNPRPIDVAHNATLDRLDNELANTFYNNPANSNTSNLIYDNELLATAALNGNSATISRTTDLYNFPREARFIDSSTRTNHRQIGTNQPTGDDGLINTNGKRINEEENGNGYFNDYHRTNWINNNEARKFTFNYFYTI